MPPGVFNLLLRRDIGGRGIAISLKLGLSSARYTATGRSGLVENAASAVEFRFGIDGRDVVDWRTSPASRRQISSAGRTAAAVYPSATGRRLAAAAAHAFRYRERAPPSAAPRPPPSPAPPEESALPRRPPLPPASPGIILLYDLSRRWSDVPVTIPHLHPARQADDDGVIFARRTVESLRLPLSDDCDVPAAEPAHPPSLSPPMCRVGLRLNLHRE